MSSFPKSVLGTRVGALLLALLCPLAAHSQRVPVPTRAGTVLLYRFSNGASFSDSVMIAGPGGVQVLRSSFDSLGRKTASANRYLRFTPDGVMLSVPQTATEQLAFPAAWPPLASWDYLLQGNRYSYTPRDTTTLNLAFGSLFAREFVLRVTPQGQAGAAGGAVLTVWMADSIGFVKSTANPPRPATDFELIEIRWPVTRTLAATSTAPRSANTETTESAQQGSSTPAPQSPRKEIRPWGIPAYIAVDTWVGFSVSGQERCDGCYNWGPQIEVGTHGSRLGIRGRYAYGWLGTQATSNAGSMDAGAIEALVRLNSNSPHEGYVALGPSWFNQSDPVVGRTYMKAIAASVGYAFANGKEGAWVFEGTYFGGNVPFETLYRRTPAFVTTIGYRFY